MFLWDSAKLQSWVSSITEAQDFNLVQLRCSMFHLWKKSNKTDCTYFDMLKQTAQSEYKSIQVSYSPTKQHHLKQYENTKYGKSLDCFPQINFLIGVQCTYSFYFQLLNCPTCHLRITMFYLHFWPNSSQHQNHSENKLCCLHVKNRSSLSHTHAFLKNHFVLSPAF